MQIILKSTCKKLSKQSKHPLTYNVGVDSGHYHFRISHNEGGHFSSQWIKLDDALAAMPEDEVFSASILGKLYESANSNNPGFLGASLLAEGIIESVKESQRMHRMADVSNFRKRMAKLVKDKVSLPDEIAAMEAEKEAKRQKLMAALQKKQKAAAKKPTKTTAQSKS
jgi:hypothetical protein